MNSTSLGTSHQSVVAALQATYGITLLREVLAESTGQAVMELLRILSSPESHAEEAAAAYSNAFRELASAANGEALSALPDAWQAYLLTRLIDTATLGVLRLSVLALQG